MNGSRSTTARRRQLQAGFTLAEMVMVVAIIALLSTIVLPVAKFTVKRNKEAELRLALRQMRTAIDEHKRLSDQGMIPVKLAGEGYPESLEVLVEGIDLVGQERKQRFLRRIPIDPMTGEAEWGLRSYQDEPDSTSFGGQNVYDVYSLSDGTGLDGTAYKDW
ncbi:MAG: type II secretion system GspH family protein [Thermoanaerobaculales bacterium]|jgi:general secretion pathway protein G|nr:type II secretion system GspH family protein [Thermoanaerobaculales bacterium]